MLPYLGHNLEENTDKITTEITKEDLRGKQEEREKDESGQEWPDLDLGIDIFQDQSTR